MYHEFCGLYQIAKERYSLTYKVKYTANDCILSIYRGEKLIIRVSEDEPERMYKVAADRLKSYIVVNEKSHA